MKTKTPSRILLAESERYRSKAGVLALEHLRKPNALTERLVRDHLIRAESFKTAATLLACKLVNRKS